MTKKVNRIFLIIAVFFLILSVLIPVVDYYMTKAKTMDKGSFTSGTEYENSIVYLQKLINGEANYLNNFYSYFEYNYELVNKESIIYQAVEQLKGAEFTEIEVWYNVTPEAHETLFLFYILDKVLWLFVAYCIFVIPISMVDLFSKVIKKGVE